MDENFLRGKKMIRGVSRQMIEIQETGNLYYEKAYFIVKPEYDQLDRAFLEKEARKVLQKIDAPGEMKKRRKRSLLKILWLTLCFGVGTGLSWLLFTLF